MPPGERIRELSAQLLRAQNPIVIQMVADQLQAAIEDYIASVQQDFPVIELSALNDDPSPGFMSKKNVL